MTPSAERTETQDRRPFPTVMEPLVGVRECANHFHVNKSQIQKLAREEKIPSFLLSTGSRSFYRFRLSEVEKALAKKAKK